MTESNTANENKDDDFSKKAEQKWSTAANSYVRYFEPMTVVAGRFLLSQLKLRFPPKPLKILEAGCGAGGLARELLLDAASSNNSSLSIQELVLTDLSSGMLERARTLLQNTVGLESIIENSNKNNKYNNNLPAFRFEAADFTSFQQFFDGSFDRYYSNLCLHYAQDPDKVIAEASRVLTSDGGIAGFTVWGRRSHSPTMTIVPDILKEIQKIPKDDDAPTPTTPKRSSFHMGEDDAALRERFLKDGLFAKCSVVHYPAVLEALDAKDYAEAILDGAPSTKRELQEDYTPEDQQQIRSKVMQKAQEILDRGEPLVLDMAMVVAQK